MTTINLPALAAALRAAADALDGVETPAAAPAAAAAPAKRGRGRPVAGETPPAPAAAPEAPALEAPAPAPAAPKHTLAEVRASLTALREATSQDNAVKVLKGVFAGAFNDLPADKYDAVVEAAKAALPAPAASVVEEDPFGLPPEAPAAAPVTLTFEDVKKALIDAQKRTSADTVQKVVMNHGGVAVVAGKPPQPSPKALAPETYASVIADLAALPTTK